MIRIVLVLALLSFCVSSCAYNKQTLLEVEAKKMKAGLGPGTLIEGEDGKGRLYRQVSLAMPADKAMDKFKNVKTFDGTDGEKTKGGVDITE